VTDRRARAAVRAELHDRATRLAWRRLDVAFLWHLLSTIPEARAAAGDEDRSEIDIMRPLALLNDLVDADRGELAEALAAAVRRLPREAREGRGRAPEDSERSRRRSGGDEAMD
jgi:hypothetical protein